MLYIFNPNETLIALLKPDFTRSTGPTTSAQAFLSANYPAEFDREPTSGCPYWDAIHHEVLNGENTFRFTVPGNQADAAYVAEGNLVAFKDLDAAWQFFEIKKLVDVHGDGLTRTAYCEHIFYELLDDIVTDRRPSADATAALAGMLDGTRWQVGIVDDLGASSTSAYYESALSAVQKVANAWHGELNWRCVIQGGAITRYVDLLAQRGTDTGKQFAYSKDILNIEREVDSSGVVTALYGRGKGIELDSGSYGRRLTFADIEAEDKPLGQEWVGDDEALAIWGRPGGRHRFDVFTDEEETDAETLLEKTRAELAKRKVPRITYRLDVISLEELTGYGHEAVRIGDLVRVIDREFEPELVVSARVVEIERDLLQPAKTKIVLGSFAPTIVDATINTQRQVSDLQNKPFNTAWLDGKISVLQNAIENTSSYVFQTEDDGILIMDAATFADATKAMKLGGGIFALANSKTGDTWNWRTFGDGAGFTADEINAGQIRTELVRILGNTEFYWDGDYLYIINPDDQNQQIRLSKEGIRFTKDGGQTWLVAMDFDGIRMEGASQDGHTHYTGDGTKVYDAAGNLVGHLGSFESLGDQIATFTRASTAYKQDGSLVAAGVPRYESVGDRLGVLIEKATTNLVTSPKMQTDSNADGVVDGFTSWKRAEITGTFSLDSAQKISVTANAYGSTGILAYVTQTVTGFAAGEAVSISVKARTGGESGVQAILRCFALDSSSVSLGAIGTDSITTSAAETDLVIAGATLPANTAKILVYLIFNVSTVGATGNVWFKYLQIEKKPQKTTFHDSSRVTDALTIPTSGVITPDNGTVEINAFVNPYTQNALGYVVGHATATAVGVGGWYPNFIGLYINQTGVVFSTSDTEGYSSSAIWGTALTVGLHKFTIAWDSTELVLLVDGVRRASVANPKLPTALAATFNVGGWISSGLEICTILNDLRVSSVKRSDEDDLAAYTSGLPLTVDDATTLLMSCDGHLQPTVRDYGLWSKNGRFVLQDPKAGQGIEVWQNDMLKVLIGLLSTGKIGMKVNDGEIYSSIVRTGAENSNTYVGIESPNKLVAYYNGQKVFETLANSSQGHLKFFEEGVQRGLIYAGGQSNPTFYILAEDGSGVKKRLYLQGSNVDVFGSTITLDPSVEVLVQGDFHVFGGTKDCQEQTENYGKRLLSARESPEIRYIDEGKATLINGECTVYLDPIFLECIEPNTSVTPWLIQLTPYADVGLYVKEVGAGYFVVKERGDGISNSTFTWSLSATRINFANIRMREVL